MLIYLSIVVIWVGCLWSQTPFRLAFDKMSENPNAGDAERSLGEGMEVDVGPSTRSPAVPEATEATTSSRS